MLIVAVNEIFDSSHIIHHLVYVHYNGTLFSFFWFLTFFKRFMLSKNAENAENNYWIKSKELKKTIENWISKVEKLMEVIKNCINWNEFFIELHIGCYIRHIICTLSWFFSLTELMLI